MAPPPPQLAAISCHLRRNPAVPLPHAKLLLLMLTLVSYNNLCSSQTMIENLPGFPGKLPFKLQTGYIGVGENEEVQLFYYFVESESNHPEDDPLILWLSGGPGCSGLFGLAHKIGPLDFDYTKSNGSLPVFMLNNNSWTQVANIIFLDQPGAGFSYANTSKPLYTSDTSLATHTYEFLRKWLINHPKYFENPLYIGGDTYSGIFLPLVVSHVYNGIEVGSQPHMNMKGYVLGNPLTDRYIDINGRIRYAHQMGLLSDRLYQSAKVHCHENYQDVDPENVLCLRDMEKINECLVKIHMANILKPECGELWKEKQHILSWQIPSSEDSSTNSFLQSVVPTPETQCPNTLYMVFHTWANDKSVQKALHIREGTITEWVRCNKTVSGGNLPDVQSAVPYHHYFTRKSCRALIYSGDHDMKVPHTATEKWIESLKLPILSDWRPWFVEGQVGGYTMQYRHGDYELTYSTVKGGGHVATLFRPSEVFAMINRWFNEGAL